MLSIKEVAARLGTSPDSVRRWIRNGELRAVRLGRTKAGYRVDPADLQSFLAARQTKVLS